MKSFYRSLLAGMVISFQAYASATPPPLPLQMPVSSLSGIASHISMPADNFSLPPMPHASSPAEKMLDIMAYNANFTGDISGKKVMTFQTLASSLAPSAGLGTTILKPTETDGVYIIENFWEHGINATIHIDRSNGTVSLPNQSIATIDGLGTIELAYCNTDGSLDRTKAITGSIRADGSILIDAWWGIYVSEGTYKDRALCWYYNTLLLNPNATMRETRRDSSPTTPGEYAVIASQNGNVLQIVNFANHGCTVELILTDERAAVIEQQLAAMDVQYGNIYTSSIADNSDGTVTLRPTIYTKPSADNRIIRWSDWTLRSSTSYFGYMSAGEITTDFDISYPDMTVTPDGDGTQENPYMLKTIADLDYLRRQTTANATSGKYYALANDIDLSGMRFIPIGSPENPFCGNFNGNNHTISNLLIERKSEGYAALIGYASAESRICNLRLKNPHVTSTGRYNAALAAWSDGEISGCEIMSPAIGSDYAYTSGLAAHANIVTDCHVFMGQIVGLGGATAGMVADLRGRMTDCGVADCMVYSGAGMFSTAGGLAAISSEGVTIADSYFHGVVSGRPTTDKGQCIGGLVGSAQKTAIHRCFAIGTIENFTSSANTGGLAGSFSGTMSDCFSAGRVMAPSSTYTGGLVGIIPFGENATIACCYTAAETLASVKSDDNTKTTCRELIGHYDVSTTSVENIYFDSNICRLGNTSHALTTAQLTSANGIEGFDRNVWTFTEGCYPRLNSLLTTAAQAQAATAIQFQGADHLKRITSDTPVRTLGQTRLQFIYNGKLTSSGRGAEISGNTIRLNGNFATDTLVIMYNNTDYYYHIVQFAPSQFEGEGTAENPYLIKDASDMNRLADITSHSLQPFTDTYFRMTNDIDMDGDTIFCGIGLVPYSSSVTFNGVFDGAGYRIKNLRMGKVVWTTAPSSEDSWDGGMWEATKQSGFNAIFGTLGRSAIVRNLTVDESCVFEGGNYSAGIAVSNSGKIEQCRNYAKVRTLGNNAAGITCVNSGKITGCLNAGNIHANGSYGAGIAATNFGDICNVANTGDITTKAIAKVYRATTPSSMYGGGIVAYNNGRTISDALNAGYIDCTSASGGIVGYNPHYGNGTDYNRLIRCLNYGIVTATTANLGAIAGQGSTSGTVENVYWDEQILPILPNAGAILAGMTGSSTAALTSGSLPAGFSSDAWICRKGMYPMLTSFADDAAMLNAAHTVITLADDENTGAISQAAMLAAADGLHWSLEKGTAFVIADNKLVPPAEVSTAVTDILTATMGSYRKSFHITRIPPITLQGSGTEADPYQLSDATDWNTLAAYVNDNKTDMARMYVRLMADIDFTGKTFTPITGSQWNATLLGSNHKLTGIDHTFTAGKMGAIAILGPMGQIRDLTIEGKFTQTKATYAAAFVGELYGKVINCTNKAQVTGNKSYRAGIAALAYEGAEFTDCVNYGVIDATTTTAGNAAGICSEVKGPVTFLRCKNYGQTSGGTYCAGIVAKCVQSTLIECANLGDQNNDVSFWGGIIGSADGNAAISTPYIIERCYNTASLRAKGNVAGIIATSATSNNPMQITGCYNTGNIVAQGTVGKAAGLFGKVGRRSLVKDCYNTGKIEVLQSKSYAAGIMAETGNGENENNPTVIENCHNTGDITSTGALAGGIACQAGSYVSFIDCHNEADIQAATYSVGGILANCLGAGLQITNCVNEGNVTAGTYNAGGIAGTTQTNKARIYGCVNVGSVRSIGTTPGFGNSCAVGGIAGCTGAEITDCYNAGTVSGIYQVGGLVGQTYAKTNSAVITIARCYNMGNIEAPDSVSGAIIGINIDRPEANTYWNAEASVTDTYYLENTTSSVLPATGVGITAAQLGSLDLGEAWIAGDDYTFPMLKAHAANELLPLYAAALHFSSGESQNKVTRSFNAGCPSGLIWTADNNALRPDGNRIHVTNDAFTGDVVLTAACGKYSRQYVISIDKTMGVDTDSDESAIPLAIRYYTPAGTEIRKEDMTPGSVYIAVRIYAGGNVSKDKFVATMQ